MKFLPGYLLLLLLLPVIFSCDRRGDELWEDEKNLIRNYLQDNGINYYTEDPESGYFFYLTDSDGTGGRPNSNSLVEVNYRIEGLDGTLFVESNSGETERIELSQSIVGLQFGMSNFSIGTKGYLILPSRLAYGKKGYTDDYGDEIIPPNTVLVIYVELVEVHPHF
jgi:FKBP-type peptidyl-prolyl cis-trans isomerase FkpA